MIISCFRLQVQWENTHTCVITTKRVHISALTEKKQLCMLHSIEIYITKHEYTTRGNWVIYGRTEKGMTII